MIPIAPSGGFDPGRYHAAAVRRRTVFLLHDVEGYTHDDIARELGITAGASKSQLFKARAKLRRLLAHLVDVPTPATDKRHVAPRS
jgi:RNA polymerase sigma-70 factor (ECF subfamily)